MTRGLDTAYFRAQKAADELSKTATTFSNASNDVLYGSFGGAVGSLVGVSVVLATGAWLAVPVIVPMVLLGTTSGVMISRERRDRRDRQLTIEIIRQEMLNLPEESSPRMLLALEDKYIELLGFDEGRLGLPAPEQDQRDLPLLENSSNKQKVSRD